MTKVRSLILGALIAFGNTVLLSNQPDLDFSSFASAQGQQSDQRPGPPGTIRVRVRLIPVDVIVVDKSGKPVRDLKKEDFTMLENGHPQEIRHFSIETLTDASSSPDERPQLRRVPALELAPQPARTFLILLGRGRHQSNFKSIDALIRFVRTDLLQQDRVAVFAYNRATDFTTNHEQMAQVLERYKAVNDRIETWMDNRFSGLAAVYGSAEIPESWQSEIDRIFALDADLGFRRLPPGRMTEKGSIAQDLLEEFDFKQREEAQRKLRESSGGGLKEGLATEKTATDNAKQGFEQLEQAEANARSDLPFEQFASASAVMMQDVQNMLSSIEYLRFMEGEKHLLFFTENGLFLPNTKYDKGIGTIANDARVAIHPFQTGGTYMGSGPWGVAFSTKPSAPKRAGDDARTFALYSLMNIAEFTGGRSAIHQDIGKALSRVNEMTRTEYLLGYYPAETNWDGRFRSITVKLNRPGLKALYRHGYYALDTIQLHDRQEFLAYSRIAAAASYGPVLTDLPLKVSTTRRIYSAGQSQTQVDLNLDASKVRFKAKNSHYSGKLRIAVLRIGGRGEYLGDDWQTIDMDLEEETYQKVVREGFPFSISVPTTTSRQLAKIVVYDFGSDKVGSVVTRLR
jgi:VWFA-related protein